ncbi:hypothetical protein ACSMXN_05715 [Jatrophihabitans sp. DSM 45814]
MQSLPRDNDGSRAITDHITHLPSGHRWIWPDLDGSSRTWLALGGVACAMCFFALLGLAGIYARQAVKSGWLGLAGYVLLSLWLVLITASALSRLSSCRI